MDTPNVLIEMADLSRTHPGLNASDAEQAAWYRRKAVVMEHAGRTPAAVVALVHAYRLDHTNGDGLVAA